MAKKHGAVPRGFDRPVKLDAHSQPGSQPKETEKAAASKRQEADPLLNLSERHSLHPQ